jgi:hypothetical protein
MSETSIADNRAQEWCDQLAALAIRNRHGEFRASAPAHRWEKSSLHQTFEQEKTCRHIARGIAEIMWALSSLVAQ